MKNEVNQEAIIPEPLKSETITERRSNGSLRIYLKNNDPDMCDKSFANQCDVNLIMKKYKKDGVILHLNRTQGRYADLTNAPDYDTAMNIVVQAQETFLTLPSEIRERFANDPARLIEFLNDPKNAEEGIKLGLLEKRVENNVEQKNEIKNEKQNDVKSNAKKDPET